MQQQNINLLFENKIGCVSNLFGFNDGEREILKTASWMSLNDMMLNQQRDYNEDEFHIAQWMMIIKIGKNVASFFILGPQAENELSFPLLLLHCSTNTSPMRFSLTVTIFFSTSTSKRTPSAAGNMYSLSPSRMT